MHTCVSWHKLKKARNMILVVLPAFSYNPACYLEMEKPYLRTVVWYEYVVIVLYYYRSSDFKRICFNCSV